jgi:hypothetical protein
MKNGDYLMFLLLIGEEAEVGLQVCYKRNGFFKFFDQNKTFRASSGRKAHIDWHLNL